MVVLGGLLGGCGKKGDPLPPFRNIPAATKDLTALQRGDEVVLRFGYPKTTTAGRPLAGLDRVEVWEVVRPLPPPPATLPAAEPATPPAGEGPETKAEGAAEPAGGSEPAPEKPQEPTAPTTAAPAPTPAAPTPPKPAAPTLPPPLDPRELAGSGTKRLELTGDELTAATQGDRIVVHLPLTAPQPAETQVRYLAVRTGAGKELSAFSNQAVLLTRPAPAGPNRIELTAKADGVAVAWSGGTEEVEGYHVYRRDAEVRELGDPLGFVPAEERNYSDRTARYGQRYIYSVTAVARRTPLVESGVAAAREIDYRDRFPPPAPGGLVALADPGRVRLVWDAPAAGTVPDLAGYQVSRRRGAGPWQPVTPKPQTATELVDTDVTAGETLAYRVTAVDKLGNESEPSETSATVPRQP